MSSAGQALGMVVGGVIGAFVPGGYIALGASIGGMIGSAIDPPKGPNTQGPRLADLKQQTASYGVPIPRVYGKSAIFGNVFWIENNQLKEVATKKKTGGKGGGSKGSVTEYSYYGTFALGVCLGPIDVINRIWLNGKLFYAGSSGDVSTVSESANKEQYFTVYLGTDDQLPDPRMQATLGVNGTPAYRGLCYIVFKDLPLADFGNTIVGTQVKVEVIASGVSTAPTVLFGETTPSFPSPSIITGMNSGIISAQYVSSGLNLCRALPGGAVFGGEDIPLAIQSTSPDLLLFGQIGFVNNAYYWAKRLITPEYPELVSGTILKGGYDWNDSAVVRIDAGIVANRLAMSLSANWSPRVVATDVRGRGFLVIDWDARYYFIDFDGVLFEAGDFISPPAGNFYYTYANGSGENLIDAAGYRAVSFDSAVMRVVNLYSVHIDSYLIRNGELRLEHQSVYIASHVAATGPFVPVSVFLQDHLVGAVVGGCAVFVDLAAQTVTPANVRDIVVAECALSRYLEPSDIDASELNKEIVGYTVGSVGQLRAPIEQLQAFYPFDVFQDGYKILFRPRGGASLATYDAADLVIEGEGDAILTRVRETDSHLPVRVSVKYSDAGREYDLSEQYAERHDGDLANVRAIELPIVMSANEAAGVAQRLLYLYWLERYEISFTLPPTARKHQPSDIITLTTPDETLLVRLTTVEDYPDARLACTARLAGQTLYTPAAVGEVTPAPSEVLIPNGPTMAQLLDIPYLMSGMNEPGFVGAMYSPLETWSGGVFFNSNDGGESWDAIRPVLENATVGVATTVLGAPASYLIVDAASSVTVRLNHGTLSSVTLLAMFAGANHFAIGVNGRWEICAAQTVVANSDGTYTLSNLMRGRYGTEQYGGAHALGDVFVLLEQSSLQFITVPVSNIGLQKLWRAVGRDKTIDSASDIAFTYAGENLECRSPIRLRGNRNPSTFDWTIEWERRTRTPVEPFSGVATPLGETSESYEVEIWDAGYTTLKRTLTGLTSKSATWTLAQQTGDFGAKQNSISCRVYQLSSIVGRGYPLSGSLTQILSADPLIDLVVLGLHMDGTNGSTTFSDVMGNSITAYGSAQISTAQYAPLTGNTASGYFDGIGSYLSCTTPELSFGTGDLTAESRFFISSLPSQPYAHIFDTRINDGTGFALGIQSDGKVFLFSINAFRVQAGSVNVGAWNHLAMVRASGVTKVFLNGDQVGSDWANTSDYTETTLLIGKYYASTAYPLAGYLDDVRITKAARYVANFIPSTEPFPNP